MDSTIFIIDDDASVRDAVGLLLGCRGYRTAVFADAASFLEAYRPDWCGCLLIDIRMPGMDGLALQRRLREIGCSIPAIIITGHGDVESARIAFRAEAVDFLEKPLDEARLFQALDDALALQASVRDERQIKLDRENTLSRLTQREQEVMELVVAGMHNRNIALELGISVRTVEVHKARMMSKLGADGVPQLVRIHLGLAKVAT